MEELTEKEREDFNKWMKKREEIGSEISKEIGDTVKEIISEIIKTRNVSFPQVASLSINLYFSRGALYWLNNPSLRKDKKAMAASYIYCEWALSQIFSEKLYESYEGFVSKDDIGKKMLSYLNSEQETYVHQSVQEHVQDRLDFEKKRAQSSGKLSKDRERLLARIMKNE